MAENRMEIKSEWTFNSKDVASKFDRHVREQLPWYDLVTGAVVHVARHYIPRDGLVYDVGAATGNIGNALLDTLSARNARFVAIEKEEAMAARYGGPGQVVVADALEHEFEDYDVLICFLTMMFFPVRKRAQWLRDVVARCRTGGAVIIVDKVEAQSGYLGTAMSRLTMAGKLSTGTPADEILAKELSLGGVQRPIHQRFLELTVGGAEEFFRFGEFAGWVIESHCR